MLANPAKGSITPSILVVLGVKPLNCFQGCCSCPHNNVAVVATTVKLLLVAIVATAVDCVQMTSESAKILASQAMQALDDASRWMKDDVLITSNSKLPSLQRQVIYNVEAAKVILMTLQVECSCMDIPTAIMHACAL